MTLSELNGKRIVLVGFEATNRAFFSHLREVYPDLHITIADANLELELPDDPNVSSQLGEGYLAGIDTFDVIVRSPGVRYWPELEAVRDRVTTATSIFFHTVRAETQAKFIGVTGTKGKSTTSSMVFELLKTAGHDTQLVGNVGNPDWEIFDQIADNTWIVYELSSYMLEDFTSYPDIAVMLNIFPDHLDWHSDYASYVNAKAMITSRQTEDDLLIFHALFDELVLISKHTQAFRMPVKVMNGLHWDKEWYYDGGKEVMKTSAVKLLGAHNKDNVLAVLAVAKALKIDYAHVETMLENFQPLPHRLEVVATVDGATYVDDAISTTPESTIAAVKSFDNVGSIVLGGLDRGYDYDELAQLLTNRHVAIIALFPGARDKIKRALTRSNYEGEIIEVEDMIGAVDALSKHTPKDHVALLSTAAPSYDQYKSFKDQGRQFQAAVQNLQS